MSAVAKRTAEKRAINLPRPKGWAVYNDAGASQAQILATIEKLNTAFEAFKQKNDESIEALKTGRDDVVTREHVDRISAEVTKQNEALEEMRKSVSAALVNGGTNDNDEPGKTAEHRAHARAFRNHLRKGVDAGLRDMEIKAALSNDSDPDGGFVVPIELDQNIGRVLTTISAMRRLATVRPIGTSVLRKVHNLGGSTTGWVGEQDARADTANPTLAQLEFNVMEVYAQPQATQTFLDDAFVNVEQWLADELAIAFAEKEGDAFINGDGVKKPRGILQYTKVANASYGVSTAANWARTGYIATGASGAFVSTTATASGMDNLVDVTHALRQQFIPGATWLMSRATLGTTRKIRDETTGHYVWQPATATEPQSILGYGVEIDDNMPAIAANSFSIAFGDFRQGYIIVDRMGTRVLRDPYTNKPYVRFYTTKRVGGGIQNFEAIKLLKFGTS